MRKILTGIIMIMFISVFVVGCGNSGVSQEEYDRVVAERDELKNQTANEENPAKDFFEEIDGVTVSESGDSRRRSLVLTCYVEFQTESEEVSRVSSSVGEKLVAAQKEKWFDYDYVLIDFWSNLLGRVVSITIDANNLSEPMQAKQWYGEEADNQQQPTQGNYGEIESKETADKEIKADVVEECYYIDSIGSAHYFLIIKNNSSETISVSVNATAKDAEGNLIGTTTQSEEAIPSGYEVCIGCYFSDAKNAASFEYTLDAKKDKYYEAVIQDLTYEESRTDKKVIISCTNNGKDAAEFVKATALFFLNGELIRSDSTYMTDDDSEIKPGATIIKEMNSFGEYDDAKIYFSGRK